MHGGGGGGVFGESPPSHSGVGWLMGATPPEHNGLYGSSPLYGSFMGAGSGGRRSGVMGSSPPFGPGSRPQSLTGTSVPLAKFQHPSHALLEENGFKQIKYLKFYKRCIDDRAAKGGLAKGDQAAKGDRAAKGGWVSGWVSSVEWS